MDAIYPNPTFSILPQEITMFLNDTFCQSMLRPPPPSPPPPHPHPPPHPPPPAKSRKLKAPTLRAADWEPVKARIIELYIDRNLALPKVKDIVEKEHLFTATLRQYRSAISQWGLDKNIKRNVMHAIARKRQQRRLVESDKPDLKFKVHNNVVESEKIDTWMKRNNIPDDALHVPSPAASAPAELNAWTPPEQATSSPGTPKSMHSPMVVPISPSASFGAHSVVQSPAAMISVASETGSVKFNTRQSPTPRPAPHEPPPTSPSSSAAIEIYPPQLQHCQSLLSETAIRYQPSLVLLRQRRYHDIEDILQEIHGHFDLLYAVEDQRTLELCFRYVEVIFDSDLDDLETLTNMGEGESGS